MKKLLAIGLLLTALVTMGATQGLYVPPWAVGQIPGTATNDNACAGCVGEYIESVVSSATPTALPTATNVNLTTINLTPGDWNVFGSVTLVSDGTAAPTRVRGGVSAGSATFPFGTAARSYSVLQGFTFTLAAAASITLPLNTVRITVPAGPNLTVYLIAESVYVAGTVTGYGFIGARRAR